MTVTAKYISTWNSTKDRGPRGFPGASGGISVPDAEDILTNLLTVDGTGSDLDADKLDGQHGAYYAPIADPTFTGTVTVASELRVTSPGNGIIGSLLDASTQKLESGSTSGYRAAVEVYGGSATPANTIKFILASAEVARINSIGISTGGFTPTHQADIYKASGQSTAVIGSGASGDAVLVLDASNGDAVGSDYYTISHVRSGNLLSLGYGVNHFCLNSTGLAGFGFTSQLAKVAINGGLHVGGESDPGDNNLLVDGTIKGESVESVTAYSTGFFGDGYKIIETGGETTAEFDNLIVRKLLKAYEMEVDRIDVIGGSLVISPASGTVYSVDGTNLYFDTNNNSNPIQFQVNDYIGAQQWVNYDHTVIASYRGKVTAVHQSATLGSAYIETTTISGTAWAGMRLAQLGNSSDTARQSLLYLTSADTGNPFIEAHTEVTAGVFTDDTRKFRLGNLTGVTDPTYGALSGYGLYSQNVYLTGWIKATSGSIGGWDIDTDAIYSGTKSTSDGYSADGITLAADGSIHAQYFYINADGEAFLAALDMPHLVRKGVSNNVRHNHNAEATTTSDSYVLLKTITLTHGIRGTIRVTYDVKLTGTTSAKCTVGFYGIPVVASENVVTTPNNWYGFSIDVSAVFKGNDTVELWAMTTDPTESDIAHVQNFKISYDDDPIVTVASVNS